MHFIFELNWDSLNEGHFHLELECLNEALVLFNQSYLIRVYLIWINFLSFFSAGNEKKSVLGINIFFKFMLCFAQHKNIGL